MTTDALQHFLAENGFNAAEQAIILPHFKSKVYAKNDYFVEEGKNNQYLGFIERGVFQYFYNLDGDEITTYVVGKGGFVASLVSYLRHTPAREAIRATTDSQVWLLHKNDVEALRQKMEKFQQFYIGLIEYQIVCIDNSRFDLITLNAEQRYEKLLQEEPHLLQQIPLQYLASILGITPRHLSRIRKNIR